MALQLHYVYLFVSVCLVTQTAFEYIYEIMKFFILYEPKKFHFLCFVLALVQTLR